MRKWAFIANGTTTHQVGDSVNFLFFDKPGFAAR
jgi:hypothetical protein